ncbi:low molecular weight protein-tyrosine-phosphatase [Thiohalobacter sp. IOR34]|uniref:low molecular weight protein-tyrosine-phosphatase n=1 Tax=Thiohalobacter sp. IOR34 TaxID=3057176 RepID=UPI0025B0DC1A|nr:low molecular weight protein-tyrosine-phosphatase [Thiohalobacter sp. IOR34]WJW76786.1 low molecular weight protein-tyrosine-phosphatase [Thiohalobacter sp. IOR34]
MTIDKEVRVLFVCMGNICRSPTAQGVFARLLEQEGLADRVHVDSAGTHAYHVGNPPDERAQEAALQRGVDLAGQRARKVSEEDFREFDYVIAMDSSNYEDLQAICDPDYADRLHRFMDFAPGIDETEVPDPYYGGRQGFNRVLDLIELAAAGLLETIRQRHGL